VRSTWSTASGSSRCNARANKNHVASLSSAYLEDEITPTFSFARAPIDRRNNERKQNTYDSVSRYVSNRPLRPRPRRYDMGHRYTKMVGGLGTRPPTRPFVVRHVEGPAR
jgi:hypothetical protein